MAEILVLGAGMNGLTTAMLLARDGHDVTVLERDPAEPPASADPEAPWREWERRGVNQFRLLHLMLPRWATEMQRELPEVITELESRGGLRINLITARPESATGGRRDGDERFETVTARRPVLEASVAAVAARTPGIHVRRGCAVTGLLTASNDGSGSSAVPHITGVLTEGGDAYRADLVVDACGRRSPLPSWFSSAGAEAPAEEREDCGFVYYGRHFRSMDGAAPQLLSAPLVAFDSVSVLALPADNGTWAVGVVASARDRELRALRDPDVWSRVVRGYPKFAHWIDGEPLEDDVSVMAGIEDRHRSLVHDGTPVVTGLVAVGDSWACTNPSLGRGTSIGLLHSIALRDVLREQESTGDDKFVLRFHDATQATVEPLYRMTLAFDRHRLAEIESDIEGRPYETEDPSWAITKAMAGGGAADHDVLRAYASIASLQATPPEVLSLPGMFERVLEVGAGLPQYPEPGPNRAELLGMLDG